MVDKLSSKWKNGYLYAIRLLSTVNKGARELAARLKEKGYEEDLADEIIKELEQQGILNDKRLARDSVHWAIVGKRVGPVRIQYELKKRGISSETIHDALEEYPKQKEKELALEVARERWEKLKNIDPKLKKKRVYDFLIRRGFNFELSRNIIDQLGHQKDEDS